LTDPSTLIIHIMPLAWGAAVSPVVLSIFLVIMSLSDDPKLPGLSFYLGTILVFLLVVFLGMILGNSLSAVGASDPKTTAAIDMFIGAILLVLAFRSFVVKHEKQTGGIFRYLKPKEGSSGFSVFSQFFILGTVSFLTNFTTAVFLLAAGKEIGLANAGLSGDILAIVILALITLLVVEVPLAIFLIIPKTAKKVTGPIDEWITKNGNYVSGFIVLIFGIYILFKGAKILGLF